MKEVLMILLQYYNVEEKYLDDNDDEQIVLVWQINIFEYLWNQFRTNLLCIMKFDMELRNKF